VISRKAANMVTTKFAVLVIEYSSGTVINV